MGPLRQARPSFGQGCAARYAAVFGVLVLAMAAPAAAVVVAGGSGSSARDCVVVLDVPGANTPPPPRAPRRVDCIDGDPTCDADGARNAQCRFPLQLCVNSTAVAACVPERTDAVVVLHALDDGDRRFDPDFQALQNRADLLGFPDDTTLDHCTLASSINVGLVAPTGGAGPFKLAKKRLQLRADGRASGRLVTDRDRVDFICRPEGDGLYDPHELYAGTFDRIAREVFAPRCATSGCHDSESRQGNQILLPNAAYSQIVGVSPANPVAAGDGLQRVFPGDPARSFLYRKITADLFPGYGSAMPFGAAPLGPAQVELIRLWIVGDGILGPAPETGWVPGTDQ